jgi:hypothetical protein
LVPGAYQARIDVGSQQAYIDTWGNTWAAEQAYTPALGFGVLTGGQALQVQSLSQSVANPALYKTLEQAQKLLYRFDVPPGSYLVTLKICNFNATALGQDTFRVTANGQDMLGLLDLAALAPINSVADLVFVATPGPLGLQIGLQGVSGMVSLSGIQVLGLQAAQPSATPTPAVPPLNIFLSAPLDAIPLQ